MSRMFANSIEKHIDKLKRLRGKTDRIKIEQEIKALEAALKLTDHPSTVKSIKAQIGRLKDRLEGKGTEFVEAMLDRLEEVRTIITKNPHVYQTKTGRPKGTKTTPKKPKVRKKVRKESDTPF